MKIFKKDSFSLVRQDFHSWCEWKHKKENIITFFLFFRYPEFVRTIDFRLGHTIAGFLFRLFSYPYDRHINLYCTCPNIGGGLIFQHGFSTIVSAESIGKNCRILQQVTIGHNGQKKPSIGDNCYIGSGAKIIGNVIIGNNVKVGANAVVTHNVPDNCIVAGVPAKIIKFINE